VLEPTEQVFVTALPERITVDLLGQAQAEGTPDAAKGFFARHRVVLNREADAKLKTFASNPRR
jgi:hypothetical protein